MSREPQAAQCPPPQTHPDPLPATQRAPPRLWPIAWPLFVELLLGIAVGTALATHAYTQQPPMMVLLEPGRTFNLEVINALRGLLMWRRWARLAWVPQARQVHRRLRSTRHETAAP